MAAIDPEVLALYATQPARASLAYEFGEKAHDTAAALRATNRPQGPLDFPGLTVSDVTLDVDGRALPVRVYRPEGEGPFAAMVNMHGGGWAMGSLSLDDRRMARMAAGAGVMIISVDYRLAPEHPFPAALEDGMAVLRWAAAGAGEFNADPKRLAVTGGSAGGNLAAALALMCRDQGGPELRFQFLIYPIMDCDLENGSYRAFGGGPGITKTMMEWFWHVYAGDRDRADPLMSPLRAENLAGLPPALIVTAECDVLRDEAEAYAVRLREAGVPAELIRYDGMPHGFVSLSLDLPKSAAAVERGIERMREYLA